MTCAIASASARFAAGFLVPADASRISARKVRRTARCCRRSGMTASDSSMAATAWSIAPRSSVHPEAEYRQRVGQPAPQALVRGSCGRPSSAGRRRSPGALVLVPGGGPAEHVEQPGPGPFLVRARLRQDRRREASLARLRDRSSRTRSRAISAWTSRASSGSDGGSPSTASARCSASARRWIAAGGSHSRATWSRIRGCSSTTAAGSRPTISGELVEAEALGFAAGSSRPAARPRPGLPAPISRPAARSGRPSSA